MDGLRIAKYIAAAGVCSRRGAEAKIEAGLVALNGTLVTTPATFVQPNDTVSVDGAVITPQVDVRVFMYHKPVGELCTEQDTEGRPTIFDSLARLNTAADVPRLVSVGRLDMSSSGLLLLTTQGALAGKLMDSNLVRTYRVRVFGSLNTGHMNEAKKGVIIDGERFAPVEIAAERSGGDVKNAWYTFTLTEGKNREIRRIVEHFGGQVSKLFRMRYGPIDLGDLPMGALKELDAAQIKLLEKALHG